jgi:tricorn protease
LEKAPNPNGPGRRSGWIDLSRIQVSISPPSEWEQMYREAWRLQRDHFWTEDMAEVDWQVVYERYRPLLERVSSRQRVQ